MKQTGDITIHPTPNQSLVRIIHSFYDNNQCTVIKQYNDKIFQTCGQLEWYELICTSFRLRPDSSEES